MSRQCKKCGENVPRRLVVDGKTKNLQNRRYCLKCVPFGSRSRKHSSSAKYLTDDAKRASRTTIVTKWQRKTRRERKTKLVQMFGGKCFKCGYSKCYACLDFHHRDKSIKKFAIGSDGLLKTWNTIVEEAKKCDLICRNCHGELHDAER